MLARLRDRLVDGLDVLAVDVPVRHAERLGALAELLARAAAGAARRASTRPSRCSRARRPPARCQSCARFSASWKAPVLVAPSPKNATATPLLAAELEGERGADDRGQAAADDRVRAEVAARDVVEVHRAAEAARAALLLPVELGHDRVDRRALGDRVPVGAVGRGDHVVRLERRADAARDRLLADRDVQEARQLARAEALLHLLLEAADQQHLAVELAQPLVGERRALGCSPSFSTLAIERAFNLSRREAGRAVAPDRVRTSPDLGRGDARRGARDGLATDRARPRSSAPRTRAGSARALRVRTWHGGGGVSGPQGLRTSSAASTRRASGRSLRLVAVRRPRRRPSAGPAEQPAEADELSLTESWDASRPRCRRTGATSTPSCGFGSTDYLDRAALLCAPLNPTRTDEDGLRVPRRAPLAGYGASPEMVRRCLERCDAERMRGDGRARCASSRRRETSRRRARSGGSAAARSTRRGMERGAPGTRRMADPVSWLVVERGWSRRRRLRRAGRHRRRGARRRGAPTSSTGSPSRTGSSGEPRYVPAERVASIREGSVAASTSTRPPSSGSASTIPSALRQVCTPARSGDTSARASKAPLDGPVRRACAPPPRWSRAGSRPGIWRVATGEKPPVKR